MKYIMGIMGLKDISNPIVSAGTWERPFCGLVPRLIQNSHAVSEQPAHVT